MEYGQAMRPAHDLCCKQITARACGLQWSPAYLAANSCRGLYHSTAHLVVPGMLFSQMRTGASGTTGQHKAALG
ncbi:MAG TPA: hypothetical protein VGF67_21770 [Ktedonobacteraceae bacterium]|jgi:hypothetical protein